MSLYTWPPQTAHGRVIPKNRIYEGAGATKALQAKFVDQVERMEWTHVLRHDRLNLKAADGVEELAVVAITLHKPEVDAAVLSAIERAIPRPLVLELVHGGRARLAMAWKRPSLAASGEWVTSPHFIGPWEVASALRAPLPSALDMAALYAALLDPLLPPKLSLGETLADRVARAEEAARLGREITRLESAVAREKQFNRKVELNVALKHTRKKLAILLSAAS